MAKAYGDKIGLNLVNHDGAAVVKSIRGGLAELWNSQNPSTQIQPGQRLLEANGRTDYHQILTTMKDVVEKGDHVHIWSKSQHSWFTDGWVLMVNVHSHSIEVEYKGGSLQKTMPIDSPELRKIMHLTFVDPAIGKAQPTPTEFGITLRKDDQKLGLQLVNRKGLAFVKKVVGGVVGAWNSQHPDFQIRPGDQIMQINGMRDSYQEFLSLCKHNNELEILVQRPLVV